MADRYKVIEVAQGVGPSGVSDGQGHPYTAAIAKWVLMSSSPDVYAWRIMIGAGLFQRDEAHEIVNLANYRWNELHPE